jgi:hypothetical protein
MRRVATEKTTQRGVPFSGYEALARYAIDRLSIEGARSLSPRDRAQLASAAAVLKEICEGLEERSGQ